MGHSAAPVPSTVCLQEFERFPGVALYRTSPKSMVHLTHDDICGLQLSTEDVYQRLVQAYQTEEPCIKMPKKTVIRQHGEFYTTMPILHSADLKSQFQITAKDQRSELTVISN